MEKIEGEKLFLKEIEISDISDSFMAWFDDEELMKFYTNSKKKITRVSLLASIEQGKKKGDVFTFGIYFKETLKLIGTVKLGPINKAHKTSDLVTLIGDREYLGKGLSVEAIRLGNKLAFNQFDLRKLYGGMYVSNIPSIKAYTRADWLIEGRLLGQFLVDGKNEDRLLVACFNPKYFTPEEIAKVKKNENRYY